MYSQESEDEDLLVCSLEAISGAGEDVMYGFMGDEPGNFTLDAKMGKIFTTRAFDYDSTDRQFEVDCLTVYFFCAIREYNFTMRTASLR